MPVIVKTAQDIADSFNLQQLPPGFHDDPYPIYQALREQRTRQGYARWQLFSDALR